MVKETLSSFSPISTLERQYLDGVGQRVFLFAQTNASCCLHSVGGVEGIVSGSVRTLDLGEDTQTNDSTEEGSDTPQEENNNSDEDPFAFLEQSSATDEPPEDWASPTGPARKEGGPDPFLSLHESQLGIKPEEKAEEPASSGWGGFFKRVADKTSKQLHSIAIKASKGKSSDLLVLALYDEEDEILGITEAQPVPHEKYLGVRFCAPLVVAGTMEDTKKLTIRVWIKSGASLLGSAARYFLVGTKAGVTVQSLRKDTPFSMNLHLHSTMVTDARLALCILPDQKYPKLGGRGWSLVDPDVSEYHSGSMLDRPLDQSYFFDYGRTAHLIATERATESCVVLPVAAAWTNLAAEACKVSLMHAESSALMLLADRHDSNIGEYADCEMEIAYIELAESQLAVFMIIGSWQRPDSVFEVEVIPPTTLPADKGPAGFITVASGRFFPKPCRTNILPDFMQASGGSLPSEGYLLGNLRLQIILFEASKKTNTKKVRVANVVP
jgi:hypothetical protein